MKTYSRFSIAAFVSLILWSAFATAQSPQGVSVAVRQDSRSDGSVMYNYQLTNAGTQRVVGLIVGSDYYHGTSELATYPMGWIRGSATQNSLVSPSGWEVNVITTEESPFVEIEWRNKGDADISPGKTVAGFGVLVAKPDSIYTSAHWTALLGDGTAVSGPLSMATRPKVEAKLASATPISTGQWSVDLTILNSGDSHGTVTLSKVALRTLSGSGIATVNSPAIPVDIGNIAPGNAKTVTLRLTIPTTVKKLSLIENGIFVNAEGLRSAFSTAQVLYPKHNGK